MSDAKPATVLVTVTNIGSSPELKDAAQQLGVRVEDIDAAFGLLPIDAGAGLYCVQVVADRLPAGFEQRDPYQGPFADPGIAPLGPVRRSRKTEE
ncbi:MAG: hypothetical protein IH604_15510 [Burkholderiales bacterium]|nr:hypothetical protein [Burkholderiales bacterium]